MLDDADLLIALAEIAGVFVGFGALISVRSAGASGPHELTLLRSVVSGAMVVIVASLLPVGVGRFGVAGHDLWLSSSLVLLVLFIAWIIVNRATREHAEDAATIAAMSRRAFIFLRGTIGTLVLSVTLVLVVVVLGVLPEHEPALYIAALLLNLIASGWWLLVLVFTQERVG